MERVLKTAMSDPNSEILHTFLYYVSPPPYCFCPVCLSVTQFVGATPLKLLNRISWNLVDSKDTICSCAYYQEILIAWILWELCPFELRNFRSSLSAQFLWNYWTEYHETWLVVRTPYLVVHITSKFWSPEFCGSYAPLNLEISRNLLLKQLVSATPLKLLNRISWNLVGSKDTICSCTYYQEMLIP